MRTREECAAATYGNFAAGAAINPGRKVCIRTDEGRYALLVITALSTATMTADVTVWN